MNDFGKYYPKIPEEVASRAVANVTQTQVKPSNIQTYIHDKFTRYTSLYMQGVVKQGFLPRVHGRVLGREKKSPRNCICIKLFEFG